MMSEFCQRLKKKKLEELMLANHEEGLDGAVRLIASAGQSFTL